MVGVSLKETKNEDLFGISQKSGRLVEFKIYPFKLRRRD